MSIFPEMPHEAISATAAHGIYICMLPSTAMCNHTHYIPQLLRCMRVMHAKCMSLALMPGYDL